MLDCIAHAALTELEREVIAQDPRLEALILVQVKLLSEVLLAYIEHKERKLNSQGESHASQERTAEASGSS